MAGDRYLLDTHSFIWFQENNPKIPERIMKIIEEPDNSIIFSQVSLFEISIKKKIGKLPKLLASVDEIYQQAISDGFTFLTIQNRHIYNYNKVPLYEVHRDPFDRLLIATAAAEHVSILSADEKLSLYTDIVKVIW